MTIQRSALVALAITLGAATLSAQVSEYPVKKCDEPKVPIGVLPKGFGTVAFVLSKDGRPDTTSIAVLKVIGSSVAGFKSVAARRLSGCRFDTGAGMSGPRSAVQSDLNFADSSDVDVGPAQVALAPGIGLPMESLRISRDSFPLPIDDRRLEERPRRLTCPPPRVPPPIVINGRGSSPAQARQDAQDQARTAAQQYNAINGGVLVAQIRVAIDGKPGSEVRVISVSNPMAAQNLAEQIGGCRFAPGRVYGIAVPAYVVTRVP